MTKKEQEIYEKGYKDGQVAFGLQLMIHTMKEGTRKLSKAQRDVRKKYPEMFRTE